MSKREQELERLANVNKFIAIISSMGRRFFHYQPEGGVERYAWMRVDARGHVYFIDHYSGKHIYTHYSGRWRGFSSGGTLRNLVELFRDHIKKGEHLNARYFDTGAWPRCPWGYPEECYPKLRDAALGLGIMAPTK